MKGRVACVCVYMCVGRSPYNNSVICEVGKSRVKIQSCASSSNLWLHRLSPGPRSCELDQFSVSRGFGCGQRKQYAVTMECAPKYQDFLLFKN